MNIQVIAEHSVDLDLLPQKANILDLGCRGFQFSKYFFEAGHNVHCVDCDPKIEVPLDLAPYYHCLAISDFDGLAAVIYDKDPQATRIIPYQPNGKTRSVNLIESKTLESFSRIVDVEFWNILKLDVEGAEYEIIVDLEQAPAKQLSIEFHLHTGIYGMNKIDEMVNHLKSLGYYPAKHELTIQHGLGNNFWDSLFILK